MMRLFKSMLVAVDGSEPSNAALAVACALAQQFGGTIHGRLVLPMHPQLRGRHVRWLPEAEGEKRRDAVAIARASEQLAKRRGIDLDVRVIDGDPIDELLRAADDLSADTIVIGNRGQNMLSKLLIGSVARGVTERSRLPVLIMHETPPGGGERAMTALPICSNVLVAVDGGELTATIMQYALRLPPKTSVNFVCAVDPNDFMTPATAAIYGTELEESSARQAAQRVVDTCVAEAAAAGLNAAGYVIEAAPVDAILDLASKTGTDLIVMASHGRRGIARLVLGSVAEGVAHRADIPVLLVPAGLAEDDPSRHLHQIVQGL